MKRVFSLMLLLATIMFALPSCSGDDDEPNSGIKDNIIGTWKAKEVAVDGSWIDVTKYPYTKFGMQATFYENGTYYGSGYFGSGSGTYKIKGQTIETYVDGELYFKYKVKTITSSTAEVIMSEPGSSSTLDVRLIKIR